MTFTFEDARVESENGVWLCLKVEEPVAARGFVLSRKKKRYTAEIKEHRNKRSLDANAYFWTLCDRLAAATGQPKTAIYRAAIQEIGGNSETMCMPSAGIDKFRRIWEGNGVGWVTETFPSKLPGCTNVIAYYGSSTYDTSQMSRLIDNIVQDCKAVGIETLPPHELERLKEAWNGR